MRFLFCLLLLTSISSFASPLTPADSLRKPLTLHALYTPASLIIGGLIANGHSEESIKNELAESRNRHIPRFHTHIDDYMQFSPLVFAYGLDAFGIQSKTDVLNRTAILVKGEAMALTTATILKSATHPPARRKLL